LLFISAVFLLFFQPDCSPSEETDRKICVQQTSAFLKNKAIARAGTVARSCVPERWTAC